MAGLVTMLVKDGAATPTARNGLFWSSTGDLLGNLSPLQTLTDAAGNAVYPATHADMTALISAIGGTLSVAGPLTASQLTTANLATHADALAMIAAIGGTLTVTGPLTNAQLTAAGLATHADMVSLISGVGAPIPTQAQTVSIGGVGILGTLPAFATPPTFNLGAGGTVGLAAGSAAIGTVGVTSLPSLPDGSAAIGTVGVTSLPSLPAGSAAIGTVGVTSLPALPTGANNIGLVTIANPPTSATGAAVPANANYFGFNSGGNLVGVSGANPLPVSGSFSGGTVALLAGSAAIGTVGVTSLPALPAGANTIGTVNLGTLNGAATSALQNSILTALGSPLQAGGLITVADGGDATVGAKADAAYSGTGAGSVISILKALVARMNPFGSAGVVLQQASSANGLVITGAVADGNAPSTYSHGVAGVDGGGLKRTMLTDTTGRPQVVPTSPVGGAGWGGGNATVPITALSGAAVLVCAARTGAAGVGRISVNIVNKTNVAVYLTTGVSGAEIIGLTSVGSSVTIPTTAAIYAFLGSNAAPATLNVYEIY